MSEKISRKLTTVELTSESRLLQQWLLPLARRFSPKIDELRGEDLIWRITDVLVILYGTPLALLGLLWLVIVTDLQVILHNFLMLALMFALMIFFNRLTFFSILLIRGGATLTFSISLNTVVGWTAILLFGPSALWLYQPLIWWDIYWRWRQAEPAQQWGIVQNLLSRQTSSTFFSLIALAVYQALDGTYPLPGLDAATILAALAAIMLWLAQLIIFYLPAHLFAGTQIIYKFLFSVVIADPFAILSAAIYTEIGLGIYLFFMGGLMITALLANGLSKAVERSRQRSRELEHLEALSRAMMSQICDEGNLPALLSPYLPGMFPRTDLEICLFPERHVFQHPDGHAPAPEMFWHWLKNRTEAAYFPRNVPLPWQEDTSKHPIVAVPILEPEKNTAIGGLYLKVGNIYQQWDQTGGASLIPAVQSLAGHIASALHRTQVYNQNLSVQKLENELNLAGEIQATFLPHKLPEVPGWQIEASLEPARQTSGDFYDIIPLPNGCLGVVVADVADKGLGAALLMALSRTLIRTYAAEYFTRPDLVMQAVNRRIMHDTHNDLFVTVFYGILYPRTGDFSFSNAGHNPPYLVRDQKAKRVGMAKSVPLGLFDHVTWKKEDIKVQRGDTLLLYTDGVTEAQNGQGDFFGDPRMIKLVEENAMQSSQAIHGLLLDEVHKFAAGAPISDDITLVLLKRLG